MARRVVLAAERGPSGWRNADIAAIGRSEGGPAVLREWRGTLCLEAPSGSVVSVKIASSAHLLEVLQFTTVMLKCSFHK